jgi:hypothetical protein
MLREDKKFMRIWMARLPLMAMLLLELGLKGQGNVGSIIGIVRDPAAASIPGATVTVRNAETGLRVKTQSDRVGSYQLLQLVPGPYEMTVEAAGFQSLERKGIIVRVADRVTLNVALSIGQVSERITITEAAPLLRTQDVQQGEVVNRTMLRNLPQLQRDPLRLLTLAGNVQGSGTRSGPGSDTRINGGRTVGLDYLVDGISAGTGMGRSVVQSTPTMEAVSEFKVITNGISAEYGRLSGGLVEVVTRGGANEYHGELFDYNQNTVLNANPWQQNALGGRRVQFNQNIFGGWFGGPVSIPKLYNGKNKTFFMFNYEGQRRRQAGALQTMSVPTEAERRGDFTNTVFNGIRPVFYDQLGGTRFDAAANTTFRTTVLGDGTRIPASRIHPVSQAVLGLVPLPNRAAQPGSSFVNNYIAPQNSFVNQDLWALRLDHAFSDTHRIFGRFQTLDNGSGASRWAGPASTVPETRIEPAFGLTINYDALLSPTTTLNIRAGGNHNPISRGNLLPADFSTSNIPFDGLTRQIFGTNNAPQIRLGALAPFTNSQNLNVNNATTYQGSGMVTKIISRHTLKIGAETRRFYDNVWQAGGGVFSFQAGPVHQIAGREFGFGSDISNAHAMGAFLIGVNNQANGSGFQSRANNFNYYAGFLQDDFRVSNKLTLNLGLRWDMESPVTERFDRLYMWDPDAPAPFRLNSGYNFAAVVRAAGLDPATVRTPEWVGSGFRNGAIRIANTPEFPSRLGSNYYPWQFAPRMGLAYQLSNKTVIRASAAKVFISTSGAAGAFATGGAGIRLADGADAGWHASNDNLITMISNFSNPYLPGQFTRFERTNQVANFQGTGPVGISATSRDIRMPHEWTYSLGVQRELNRNFVAEVTYNANLGRGLLGPDLSGRFPADLFSGGPTGQNARSYTTMVPSPTAGQTLQNNVVGDRQNLAVLQYAYPYFGTVVVQGSNIGRSNYHGVNMRLEKRMSGDLFFLFNYTFSKLLDDVGGPELGAGAGVAGAALGGKTPQSTDTVRNVYGISPLDETHVMRFAYNYNLPFGRGKRWMKSPDNFGQKALDFVVGGWELAGTGSYRSGRPVVLNARTPNINNNIRVEWTYGNYLTANPSIDNSRFTGFSQVFRGPLDGRSTDMVRRFDNVGDAQLFTYGNLPPIFPNTRNAGIATYDMSLMKAFRLNSDGRRYVQFRMEGNNILNMRGFGPYNTQIGTLDFGLITSPGLPARTIQASVRVVF